jgi:hypothetical protein
MTNQPRRIRATASAVGVTVMAWAATSPSTGVVADEAQARQILKSMTDYVSAQRAISFDYDATLEIVTKDQQKLELASSGTVSLARPDKVRMTRSGGFVDIETVFDGRTLTVLGRNKNVYTQVVTPGSIDRLVDELQNTYDRPLPAADLFLTRAYDELMAEVIDVKDLGSGVIGGAECDYLAFRTKDVDWQIWVAQGARPHPCRYVITSKRVANEPQYSIQLRNWQTGDEVAAVDFDFKAPAGARQIQLDELKAMKNMGELPSHFVLGGK